MMVKSGGEEEERREEERRGKKGSLLVDEVLCESNFVWAEETWLVELWPRDSPSYRLRVETATKILLSLGSTYISDRAAI